MNDELMKMNESEIVANLYQNMLTKAGCDVPTYLRYKKFDIDKGEVEAWIKGADSVDSVDFETGDITENDLVILRGEHPSAVYLIRKIGDLAFIWQDVLGHPYVKKVSGLQSFRVNRVDDKVSMIRCR